MFEGKCCRGSSGDLWPKGSIKHEDRMTAKVRTEKSYHPCSAGADAPLEGQLRISAIKRWGKMFLECLRSGKEKYLPDAWSAT